MQLGFLRSVSLQLVAGQGEGDPLLAVEPAKVVEGRKFWGTKGLLIVSCQAASLGELTMNQVSWQGAGRDVVMQEQGC